MLCLTSTNQDFYGSDFRDQDYITGHTERRVAALQTAMTAMAATLTHLERDYADEQIAERFFDEARSIASAVKEDVFDHNDRYDEWRRLEREYPLAGPLIVECA